MKIRIAPSHYDDMMSKYTRDVCRGTPADAFMGVRITADPTLPYRMPCSNCAGTGYPANQSFCASCKGTGVMNGTAIIGVVTDGSLFPLVPMQLITSPIPIRFPPRFPLGLVTPPPATRIATPVSA